MFMKYIDGIAITALTYFLSPAENKLRNTVAVGATHFLLHDTACNTLLQSKRKKDIKEAKKKVNAEIIGISTGLGFF